MTRPDTAIPTRVTFEERRTPLVRRALPWCSVVAGSVLGLLPMIATHPALPPFGLMMLIAWRLLRPAVLPVWAPAPLGLFDDLVSGQPLGSAVLLWSVMFLVLELVDARLNASRDFWQDWLVASGALAAVLVCGRLIAVPLAAHVDTMVLVQIMGSVLLFPVVARCVAWIDRRRGTT